MQRHATGSGFRTWALRALNPLALYSSVRALVYATLFVIQVLPLRVKPLEWLTRRPVREAVTFPLSDGQGSADIYRIPDHKKRPAILAFAGVILAPRDDARIVNLGNALARAGFVVMFPWSPSMQEKHIDPGEPDQLVKAFEYLKGLDYVEPRRVGMGGFCVGASIAIVAASDPRISSDVNFVSSFGGYYDMRDLLRQISSNSSFDGDTVEPWAPNHLSQEVLSNQIIGSLAEEEERKLLARIFLEKGKADDQVIDSLSREAAAAHCLLRSMVGSPGQNRLTLGKAGDCIQHLPMGLLAEMNRLSPSTNLPNLKARLLIAHDREDNLVPAEESRRLAQAHSRQGEVHHTEFSMFSHVTPDKRVGPFTFLKEAFKLFRYTYSIIRVAS